jgi:hypothetical protein
VKQHGYDAGALAERPGLDAARFGLEKSGFKRVLKKIFSGEIEELISVNGR